MQGELDAVLNFWHFCARLEANGFRRLIGADDAAKALGASGPVSALGYVFHDKWADENPDAAMGFVKASAAGQGDARQVRRGMAAPRADRCGPRARNWRCCATATAKAFPSAAGRRGRGRRRQALSQCSPKSAARSSSAARRQMAPGTFWPELAPMTADRTATAMPARAPARSGAAASRAAGVTVAARCSGFACCGASRRLLAEPCISAAGRGLAGAGQGGGERRTCPTISA